MDIFAVVFVENVADLFLDVLKCICLEDCLIKFDFDLGVVLPLVKLECSK